MTTLVMLHGGGPGVDAESNWRGVMDVLSREFDCMAPDLMGFGSNTLVEPQPEGPAQWARSRAAQVRDLLDEHGLHRVVLLGNSAAGGAAALALLAMEPARVERAVVMGGAGTGPLPPTVPFYDQPTNAGMRSVLGRLVADPADHEALLDHLTDERFTRAVSPGAESTFRSMFAPDPPGSVPVDPATIRQPVLALHGEHDRAAPVSVSGRLVDALPNGELRVVEGAGHWIHVDRPRLFCELVTTFLESSTDTQKASMQW